LRGHLDAIRAAGADLVVIGSGAVHFAKAFKTERDLDFTLLADTKLKAFVAAGLKRSVLATFSLRSAGSTARALASGERQGGVQGDALQQGGAFVILQGGDVAFAHVSKRTGDHADPQALLSALSSV
jgi:peroxiredoxin